MADTDAASIKSEVVFIEELLEEVSTGHLRIPRFQRPFVWAPTNILALYDSIGRGYPVGSVLLWESDESIASTDRIGPIVLPPTPVAPVSYVLDGHQRITSLVGILRLPKEARTGPLQEDWRWWVWFDLREKTFRHFPDGHPPAWYLPLRSILRTVDFLAEARRIQNECGEEAAALIEEAERLAQQIKNYKLLVTRIRGSTLAQTVEIFSRVNSQGQVVSVDQMVSALTYREGPFGMDLAARIDAILEGLAAQHFGGLRRITVLRSIVAASKNDIYKTDWEMLARKLTSRDLEKIVTDCEGALQKTVEFLVHDLGVISDRLLPYTNQLLLLSQFFYGCKTPKPEQLAILRRWFWASSFSGWFAGANTTQINLAVLDMERLARGEMGYFDALSVAEVSRPFPLNFDMRSARIRALIVVLLRLKPTNPDTNETFTASEILSGSEASFLTHVFPRASRGLVSRPANRVFLKRKLGVSMRDTILQLSADVCASHVIYDGALKALQDNDESTFVQRRTADLVEIERNFLSEVGVNLGDGLPTEAEVDEDSESE